MFSVFRTAGACMCSAGSCLPMIWALRRPGPKFRAPQPGGELDHQRADVATGGDPGLPAHSGGVDGGHDRGQGASSGAALSGPTWAEELARA